MTGVQNGINAGIGWFLSGWLGTYIGVGANGITLVINDVIGLGFSDRYFEVCSDGKIDGIVIGVQDGIHSGVCVCDVGRLATGFYGDSDAITLFLIKEYIFF